MGDDLWSGWRRESLVLKEEESCLIRLSYCKQGRRVLMTPLSLQAALLPQAETSLKEQELQVELRARAALRCGL